MIRSLYYPAHLIPGKIVTLCFSTPQHRIDLVTECGVTLVGHRIGVEPEGLGVGLHPTVVGCGRARAVCYLLVHTVGLREKVRCIGHSCQRCAFEGIVNRSGVFSVKLQ